MKSGCSFFFPLLWHLSKICFSVFDTFCKAFVICVHCSQWQSCRVWSFKWWLHLRVLYWTCSSVSFCYCWSCCCCMGPHFANMIRNFFCLRADQLHGQQVVLKIWKYQQMSCSKEIEKFVDVLMAVRPTLRHTTAM
jgi:hypothetical protein